MKEIVYRRCGDYYIPDLKLPEQEVLPLGKYGRMRMKYLKEHSPYLWNNHILNGTLNKHCAEIEANAEARLSELIDSMAKAEGVTEALKASDPMKWVGLMNSIKASAEEAVINEIVFAQNP